MRSVRKAMYEFLQAKTVPARRLFGFQQPDSLRFRHDTTLTIRLPPSGLPVCNANRHVHGGQRIHRAVRGA
eukprot:scaffold458272_cov18-Prasinocladus_malaysianus.AAC.1